MIYFVQPIGGGPIKIGTTANLGVRIDRLEKVYGCQLSLLATLKGGRNEEKAIHERFAHLRLGNTEQFQPGKDLLVFIGKPLLVNPDHATVEAMPFPKPDGHTVAIRCTLEWKAWLEAFATDQRINVASLVDRTLADAAERAGFRKPPVRMP